MIPSDPLYVEQWHFVGALGGISDPLGNIEKIWDEYSGAGIAVGIYDGGVELDHPDLAANYDPTRLVIIDGTPVDGEPNEAAPHQHGTNVLGLIDAAANNGTGGVGVAWGSTFTSVDILDPDSPVDINSGDPADILAAFHQLTNFDVSNHSWNGQPDFAYDPSYNLYGPTDDYGGVNSEYDHASANGRDGLGTIIVQGVGNSNIDAQYTGLNASRFTISVGGIQQDGFASSFSNYGAALLVTAPSVNMVTTHIAGVNGDPDDYIDADDNAAFPPDGLYGTSLATPLVSGVVALMLDANAGLGWRDVQNIIAASATHTGSAIGAVTPGTNENSNWFLNDAANWNGGGMHFSNDYGYGLLNAYNAVRMAEVWSLFGPAQTSTNEQFWYTEDDTDQAIPDNDDLEFDVSLPASPVGAVEHVELRIDLIHSDYTQLRIFLTSPGGTEMQLYDGSGGTDATADSFFNWTYGGEALRGETVAGTWTVRIEDSADGETGTLLWYNLVAYGSLVSSDDVYHYTDEFLAMAALAGETGRATLADTGGADWIDAAAVTGNVALNLNAGATTKVNGVNWFTIAAGTTVEHAVTGDGNDTLTGNGAANRLHGMRGNDTIDGGLGNDQMFGGKGNDTYVVSQSGDIADETGGNGTDTVKSGITFSLSDTAHAKGTIEHLTLTGIGAINATGNGSANTLTGNGAANTLDGLGSSDTMRGMGGNDTYVVAQSGDIVDETGGNGTDTVKSGITFSLSDTAHAKGTIEHLTLTGIGAINATGNGSANTLTGNAAANILDGLGSSDTMRGMGGNDTYVVAQSGDVADETGGNGADTVKSGITFSLSDTAHAKGTIEHLTLTGTGAINATGNGSANTLTGNAAANILDGLGSNDTMRGMGGNDTYVVAQSGDVADETGGNGADTVKSGITFSLSDTAHAKGTIEHLTLTGTGAINATGNGSANTLTGNAAANILDGLGSNDTMRGMGGNDTYVVAQSGDIADETGGSGTDTVKSGITFSLSDTAHAKGTIEHLTLTGTGAINGTGNTSANMLTGNGAANTLDGLGNNDTMRGMGGNDTYIVSQSGDIADETGGSGTDTVKSALTFSLTDTAHAKGTIEHLTLTGTGAINATGNASANVLTGNGAANTLDGLGNNDTMRGMGGNDTYIVAQSGDVADETGGSGTDTVKSAITFSLTDTAHAKGSIEHLTLTGALAINATGNGLANLLTGNAGANVINGAAGNDTMTGGGNADIFAFDTALNPTTNVDHIADFVSGADTLRLDASIFAKLKIGDLKKKAFFAKDGASKAKDKQDRVIYDSDSGEVRFDKDGKGKTKAVLFAVLDGSPDLAHSDVLVVA